MMTIVTGGSKCGKSAYAEKIFDNFAGRKLYIATMIPYGDEAHIAIERHRQMRKNRGFETLEKYTDIEEIYLPKGYGVLLECMGNLCANEMFKGEEMTDPTVKIISGIERLKAQTESFVIVTNEVSSDGIPYENGTMEYIRILSEINRCMAEIADNVIECVYGIPVPLKGKVL